MKESPLLILSFLVIALLPLQVMGAHANDDEHVEHHYVMALADPADATHIAAQNGDWTDPATWGGTAPTASARVHIPSGITVTVDGILTDTFRTIRLDGTLTFDHTADTELKFDTLVGQPGSTFNMGTVANPIQSDKTAKIIIEDIGNFEISNTSSPDYDPTRVGLGIILHGTVNMHGGVMREAYTSYVSADAGDTVIQLDRLPSNWEVNDEIVIANAKFDGMGDELRTITALDAVNHTLTIDTPLAEDHHTPSHTSGLTLRMHIANITRNTSIETIFGTGNRTYTEMVPTVDRNLNATTAEEFTRRGHIMLMHSNSVDIRYVKFIQLGRTNKSEDTLTNAVIDHNGTPTDISDDTIDYAAGNPIARYPLHFHRAGTTTPTTSAIVEGSVVQGSPGWGFVNHSSAVTFRNNVGYDIDGAAFVSEAGDEVGAFLENIAIKMHGQWGNENTNAKPEKFGNNGVGFWIESKMVRVRHNVASGFFDNGFQLWNEPIDDVSARFEDERVHPMWSFDPELEDPSETEINPDRATVIEDNIAYGGHTGIQIAFANDGHQHPIPHDAWNQVKGYTAYAVTTGLRKKYSNKFSFIDLVLIGNLDNPQGWAHQSINNGSGFNFIDSHFEGFDQPMDAGNKSNVGGIYGGYYNNIHKFRHEMGSTRESNFHIGGDIQFGELTTWALNGRTGVDFLGVAHFPNQGQDEQEPSTIIFDVDCTGGPYRTFLETEQNPCHMPFPCGSPQACNSPPAIIDQTNTVLAAMCTPNHFSLGMWSPCSTQLAGWTYDNVKHEADPAAFVEVLIFRNDTLPNLILPVGTTQTVIDVSEVFIDPLGEPITLAIDSNTNPGLITSSLLGNTLTLDYDGVSTGEGIVRITGSSAAPRSTSAIDAFKVEITASIPALPPLALEDTYSVDQDTPLVEPAVSGVLANDTEPNSEAMTAEIWQKTDHGSIVLNTDGSFTYTPDPTFSGTDSFVYRAVDVNGELSERTKVTITVNDTGNDGPTAVDDSHAYYSTFQGIPFNITRTIDGLLPNDTDPDGDALTVDSFTQPLSAGSSVTVNNDGTFTYTSSVSFKGTDTFTYTITDGAVTSAPATVTMEVVGPDPIPLFDEDWETGAHAVPPTAPKYIWTMTDNGSYHGGNQNTLGGDEHIHRMKKATTPESWEITGIDTTGWVGFSLQYHRALQHIQAPAYFTAQYSDDGGSNWYTLETVFETASTLSGGTPTVNGTLYEITFDGEGVDYTSIGGPNAAGAIQGATFTANGGNLPAGGNIDESPIPANEDGTIDWTEVNFPLPASVDNNPDVGIRFEFMTGAANDAQQRVDLDNIQLLGIPPNTAPVAVNDGPYVMDEDTTLSITDPLLGILDNDTDAEANTLIPIVQTYPANGTLNMNSDGTFTYIPSGEFFGTDSFTYVANDLRLSSNIATVDITINPIDDGPVPDPDTASVAMNSVTGVVIDVLANDVEEDGDPKTVVSVDNPANGTVVINGDNTITYTPDNGFAGPTEVFNYTMTDGFTQRSSSVTVTIVVSSGYATWIAGYPGVGGLNAEGDDPDGDGMDNFTEYALDADPTAGDVGAKMPTITVNGTNFDFTFHRGQTGVIYQVEKSTDLSTWNDYGAANPGSVGSDVTVQVPDTELVGGKLFLRLEVSE